VVVKVAEVVAKELAVEVSVVKVVKVGVEAVAIVC
jgi:hypothetical protein